MTIFSKDKFEEKEFSFNFVIGGYRLNLNNQNILRVLHDAIENHVKQFGLVGSSQLVSHKASRGEE